MARVTHVAPLFLAEVKNRMRTDQRADWRQRWLILYNALVEPQAASSLLPKALAISPEERSLMTTVPSHEMTTRNLGMYTHKIMMCSYMTVEMASIWLVFSQVFWKHFRS